MTDVTALVVAVETDVEAQQAWLTYATGRHALADLGVQYRVRPASSERLTDAEFDSLYAAVEEAATNPVDREQARRRLNELRAEYEPNAEGLSRLLALELPPWLRAGDREMLERGRTGIPVGRDLVG